MFPSMRNDYHALTDVMARGLELQSWGLAARKTDIADELAEQLGINPEQVMESGYDVLWAVYGALERVVGQDRDSTIYNDVLANAPSRIAELAVGDLDINVVIDAAQEFGFGSHETKSGWSWNGIKSDIRAAMAAELSGCIYRLLRKWHKKDVWKQQLGLVKMPERKAKATKHP